MAVTILNAQTPSPDSFNPGVNGAVGSIAVQADGKIFIAGNDFTTVAGQSHTNLARLNADGTLDSAFNLNLGPIDNYPSPWVDAVAVQSEGRVLIGGGFVAWNGQWQTNLTQLKPDGSTDTGFNPEATGDTENPDGSLTVIEQPDGKILIGEGCAWCQGGLVRFNRDGSKDAGFVPIKEAYGPQTLAIQPDSKILFGGVFGIVAGRPRSSIARLNADGTVDPDFNPEVDDWIPAVRPIALQADGKILLASTFTNVAGYPRTNIARLNPDGALDLAFNASVNDSVHWMALQADGKIILGGQFTAVDGQPRVGLARLNVDSSLDTGFNVEVGGLINHFVASIAIQADGKILVGGDFTSLGGQARTNIGRLNNTGPATQSLRSNGSAITWLRGGTSPEVWRTIFETSADGLTWTYLGAGLRIAGGWQITNVVIAPGSRLRARGFVAGGGHGEGIVETTLPVIIKTDGAFGIRSNAFGFNISGASGQVVVVESEKLYQRRRARTPVKWKA
jgi:uncharacterized delta-60 repeat protein